MKRTALAVLVAAFCLGVVFQLVRGRDVGVSIQELSTHRERWLGRRVRCEGKLEAFHDGASGRYYALDRDGYRIAVSGVPKERMEALLGKDAISVGTFRFRDGFGAYVQADRLASAGD